MIKVTILYHHPKDEQAFESYYKQTHLPIAAKVKGVSRLELTKFLPELGGKTPPYYRMAELYFDNEEQMKASLSSPEGKAATNDLHNFATGGVTILTGSVES